jgi:hypothetical protein
MSKTAIEFGIGEMDLDHAPINPGGIIEGSPVASPMPQVARRVYRPLKQLVGIGTGARKPAAPAMFQSQ